MALLQRSCYFKNIICRGFCPKQLLEMLRQRGRRRFIFDKIQQYHESMRHTSFCTVGAFILPVDPFLTQSRGAEFRVVVSDCYPLESNRLDIHREFVASRRKM